MQSEKYLLQKDKSFRLSKRVGNRKLKLVSIDIDDTMIPNNTFEASERFRAVVSRLEERGIRVCINTGRNVAYAMPVAKSAGIRSLCVALEGLSAFDPQTGNVVYENRLGIERVERIIDIAKDTGIFIETTDNHKYYRFLNKSPQFCYNAGQDTHGFAEYTDSAADLFARSGGALCVTLGGEKAALHEATHRIREECRGLLFRNYLWENYSIISAEACQMHGKTFGLNWLCVRYGLDFVNAVASGDYINDAGMIGRAGMGIAMGNAHRLIKSLAGWVTDPVGEDGAAKALEKVFGVCGKGK